VRVPIVNTRRDFCCVDQAAAVAQNPQRLFRRRVMGDSLDEGLQRPARQHRALAGVVVLLFVAVFAYPPIAKIRAEATAKEEAAKRAELRSAYRAQREAEYAASRASVLAEAQAAMARDAFEEAERVAGAWQDVADTDLRAIYNVAKRQAEAARKIAEAKAERTAAEAKSRLMAAEEAKNAAHRAVETRIGPQPHRSGWDGTYREVEDYLAKVAHDPDSVKIEPCTQVRETPDGWVLACTWRARNAFGAIRREDTVFIIRHGRVVSAK
jgi:hypothetical protein